MRLKLREIKEEIDKSTTIVWHFNTPVLIADRSNRQEISKNTDDLNSTIC